MQIRVPEIALGALVHIGKSGIVVTSVLKRWGRENWPIKCLKFHSRWLAAWYRQ